MTDFPDLKIKALVNFPATAAGGTGIAVVRDGSTFTIDLDHSELVPTTSSFVDLDTAFVVLWDEITDTYSRINLTDITALLSAPATPGANTQVLFNDAGVIAGNAGLTYNKTTAALLISTSGLVGFSTDVALSRVAAGVVEINTGTPGTRTGTYVQWGGQARVTGDFSKTSDTAFANVTGLSVNVAAGRTYSFAAELPFTCAAASGVKTQISGTATATNIIYNGYIVDSAANGIKGNTQATALNTSVAAANTTGTSGVIRIVGCITVNAAGTLTVQFAQNTSGGTASIVKRGATLTVHDVA